MIVSDGKISMKPEEWAEFQGLVNPPYKPRTSAEFNAMCDLAAARALADNVDGLGFMTAIACDAMKFGPNGEINFPADPRRMAYVDKYGTWPTDEELQAFLDNPDAPVHPAPVLRLVKGGEDAQPTADGQNEQGGGA